MEETTAEETSFWEHQGNYGMKPKLESLMSSEFIVTCVTCYMAIGDETQFLLHVLLLSFIFHKYKVRIALAFF